MNFLKKLFSRRKEEVIELPPEFLQATPPDWLIELKGAGIPPGHRFSIRVQLTTIPRGGTADIFILPQNGNEQPRNTVVHLSGPALDKLFVILGFSFPHDVSDVPAEEGDLPIALSIHRREPYALKTAECNLTGWLGSKKSGPPVIEIGRLLVEATELNAAGRPI